MKINCFAYDADKGCKILKKEIVCGNSCSFCKSRDDLAFGREKSNARLASLPYERQRYIADTYHNGKRAWLETDGKEADA